MNLKKFKLLRGYYERPEFPIGIVYVPYIIETRVPVVVETFQPRRMVSNRYYCSVDPATNHMITFRVGN
jgi:hypothetical protein